MKHYLVTDSIDWADECDVYFYEILNEDQYNLFSLAQKILGKLCGSFYFGSNEGFDGDFDFLAFAPKELTETEYEVLSNLSIYGESFYDRFKEYLVNFLKDEDPTILNSNKYAFNFTEKELIEGLKKYENMRNE